MKNIGKYRTFCLWVVVSVTSRCRSGGLSVIFFVGEFLSVSCLSVSCLSVSCRVTNDCRFGVSPVIYPDPDPDRIGARHPTVITLTLFNPVNDRGFPSLCHNITSWLLQHTIKSSLSMAQSDKGCLRLRKTRTHLSIPEVCLWHHRDGRQQPDRIHSDG